LLFRNIEEILAEKGETVQRLEFKEKLAKQEPDGTSVEIESNIELVVDETTSKFIKK
jgi:hypothetical protein